MSSDPKDIPARSPQGVFSGLGSVRRAADSKPKPGPEADPEPITVQAPFPRSEADFDDFSDLEDRGDPTSPGMILPDVLRGEAHPRDEVVLNEIGAMESGGPRGDRAELLLHPEEHDAWSADTTSQQNTIRPAASELEHLVELSSLRFSDLPEELTPGGALDLIDHARPSAELNLEGHMEELFALDDLSGALSAAELVLGRDPENARAARCADDCRARLIALYTSKLGRTDSIAVLALSDQELRWLGLDHRSGFLLSRIDGFSTVEELLDICGMPRLEALRTLADLLERGAIRLR